MCTVAALVLAAGRGSRFHAETASKLLAPLGGLPLVAHVAKAVLASRANPIIVVTGHAAEQVEAVFASLAVTIVRNREPETGMAGSLVTGVDALSANVSGFLVMLADMPLVRAATLDKLMECFETAPGDTEAVVPVFAGRPGNPVLIGRRMFADLRGLSGDQGARALLAQPHRKIVHCPVDDPGVAVDIDTKEALRAVEQSGSAQAADRAFS